SRFDLQPKWSKIINLWYEELQIAPNSVVHNFNLHGLNIGHFTQMAWASSRKIGCGFAAFRIVDPKFKVAHLYTCNYAPSGNRKGNSMYLEGAAMSRCPQSTQPSKKEQNESQPNYCQSREQNESQPNYCQSKEQNESQPN
ncbi:vespid v5 venom allergen-like protein, partial [Dinothrombium tinctorium]